MNIEYSGDIFSIDFEVIDESSPKRRFRLKINDNYVSNEMHSALDGNRIEIKNSDQIYPLKLFSIPFGDVNFSLKELFIDYFETIEISREHNNCNEVQLGIVCAMQNVNPYQTGIKFKKLNPNEVKESILNLYVKYKDKNIGVLLKDLQEYREAFCIGFTPDCQRFLTIGECLELLKNQLETIEEFIDFELFFFNETLNDIDALFAREGVSIKQRVRKAVIHFCTDYILDDSNKAYDGFADTVWFKALSNLIYQWYHERYGTLKRFQSTNNAVGIILIHDTPFEINIPFSMDEKLEDGKRKIWFLNSIKKNEDVFNWIVYQPNLEAINKDELDRIEEELKRIGLAYRKINRALESAVLEKQDKKDCFTILQYLQTAARYIMDRKISQSYWEVHIAIEKAVKLIIKQNGRDHSSTHNLEKLRKIATNIKGINLEEDIFSTFPCDSEAIAQRYGEGKTYSIQEAVNNYTSACSVIFTLTDKLKKNEKFHSDFYVVTRR